jgi:Domain of unknown function (DUF4188)
MDITRARMSAEIDGDFVVFLIGFRINYLWKVWKWWPVLAAMPRMLKELERHPDLGLLHAHNHLGLRSGTMVQYWRSFEQLQAYATSQSQVHLPAWKSFNKAIGSNGDVGIWHETYLVRAGDYESIYNNMPAYGLGVAGRLQPASDRRRSAKGRLNRSDGNDLADI